MTDLQRLYAIFTYIRENGMLRKPPEHRLGGIWSADIYDLGSHVAQLCDDGSTQAVINGEFRAWSTYGREVEYGRGSDASGLEAMYVEIFGPNA